MHGDVPECALVDFTKIITSGSFLGKRTYRFKFSILHSKFCKFA